MLGLAIRYLVVRLPTVCALVHDYNAHFVFEKYAPALCWLLSCWEALL